MKKIQFYSIGIVLASFLFAACAKEEVSPNHCTNNTSVSKTDPVKGDAVVDKWGPEDLRIWFDNGNPNGTAGVDYGCRGKGGRCLPEGGITVPAQLKADLRGVGEVILHGSASEIIHEFKGKRTLLEPIIGTSHVQGVINSALVPEVRGVADETMYFVFWNKNKSKVLIVYPIQ